MKSAEYNKIAKRPFKNSKRFVYYYNNLPRYYYANYKAIFKKDKLTGILAAIAAVIWIYLVTRALISSDNALSVSYCVLVYIPSAWLIYKAVDELCLKLSKRKTAMNKAVEISDAAELTSCNACGKAYVIGSCNKCPYCDAEIGMDEIM